MRGRVALHGVQETQALGTGPGSSRAQVKDLPKERPSTQ